MQIDPAKQLIGLPQFPSFRRIRIAYSGGLDSHVLLHSLWRARRMFGDIELTAIHVNHGLSPDAEPWQRHCAEQCRLLGLPFTAIPVDARPQSGESPEAAARAARYRAFAETMTAGDCLLTAHHQDDQAETLLLQLLRGAGPKGLAAMSLFTDFSQGWHIRPLLQYPRQELQAYAESHALHWIEDESNAHTGYDRNFIRHKIMPVLKARFPAAAATISRSAGLCAEAAKILSSVAQQQLAECRLAGDVLSISALRMLGETQARNVLREWIHQRGLPIPNEIHLQHIWHEVMAAAEDAEPLVCWRQVQVRRYRDKLYIAAEQPAVDRSRVLTWTPTAKLEIAGLGTLQMESAEGAGIAPIHLVDAELTVRFRDGGESLQPVGRRQHHALKKLFQEAGVPPWQRNRIPLVYRDDRLMAVTGYWIDQAFAVTGQQQGWMPALVPAGNSPDPWA